MRKVLADDIATWSALVRKAVIRIDQQQARPTGDNALAQRHRLLPHAFIATARIADDQYNAANAPGKAGKPASDNPVSKARR